jgi:EAL domain-containing protein (putative c-di-GMP-specific phosphodiesterase class I)
VLHPSDFLHRINALPEDVAALFADLAVDAARPFVTAPVPLRFGLNLTAGALDETGNQSGEWLRNVLSRLPAEQMVLELLESAVITNPTAAQATLADLRQNGVKVALDDFGTGLSNLDRVLEINPDIIKLDRRFVANLGETGRPEAVLKLMVEMTRDLDIRLIAEGLETAADTEIVRSLGINHGQGYHLGRPKPVAYWAEKLLK